LPAVTTSQQLQLARANSQQLAAITSYFKLSGSLFNQNIKWLKDVFE